MTASADQMYAALQLVHASLIMRKAAQHMPHEMRVIEAALEAYREHVAGVAQAHETLRRINWEDGSEEAC